MASNSPSGSDTLAVESSPGVAPTALGRPGILVVDDDEQLLRLLCSSLERHGFSVWTADGGAKAVELYRDNAPSIAVALLDVCMPGLDGPSTLKCLREMNGDLVACFMSGDTGVHEVAALRRQALHLFAKPFRLNDLAQTLSKVVGDATV